MKAKVAPPTARARTNRRRSKMGIRPLQHAQEASWKCFIAHLIVVADIQIEVSKGRRVCPTPDVFLLPAGALKSSATTY